MARFEEMSTLLQRGKAKDLAALVTEELANGVTPKDILTQGLIVGMGIIDLGVDCDAEKVVQAVKDNNADIVCLSSLLTTTMMYQKDVIEALKAAGIRDKVKVMVGGAPVTQAFADEIGADAYTPDAASAAEKARSYFD